MTRYRPWDREEKLGSPPWDADDPRLVDWEKAHGHDVRLKCYPEFGCLLLPSEDEYQRLADAAREVVEAWDRDWRRGVVGAVDRLRAALEESEHE